MRHIPTGLEYRHATFYAPLEVQELLLNTGFSGFIWGQTLTGPPGDLQGIEPLQEGWGQGAFVRVYHVDFFFAPIHANRAKRLSR